MHNRLLSSLVLLVTACSPDGAGLTSDALVVTDRCEIAGTGALDTGDAMSGDVHGGDLGASGEWTHTGDGRVVLTTPEWILCRINGATLGDFGGHATLDGSSGYTFRVQVQDFGDRRVQWDHGTPEVQTVSATRTYSPSRWDDGALAIDGRALVTIPSEIPVTVGGASNQWTWLTFQLSETSEVVTCRYRGDAAPPHRCGADWEGGDRYVLQRCTVDDDDESDDATETVVSAGDEVDVEWMTLHVHSGDHRLPDRRHAQTTVSVDLDVTPLVRVESDTDYYRMAVWEEATGAEVYVREGFIASGDFGVSLLPTP